MHELPLVFFTVFGQTAVGLFLMALVAFAMGQLTQRQLNNANLVAIVILAIGMAIGGLHMGKPLRAFNLIFGAVRSPMSNEILLSGAFFGFAAATVMLSVKLVQQWLADKLSMTTDKLLSLQKLANTATVLFGLAFAWSITQVYQLETVPAWNSGYTALQLWLTVLLSGGAFALAMGAYKLGSVSVVFSGAIALVSRFGYVDFVTEQVPHLAAQQHALWNGYVAAILLTLLITVITLVRNRRIAPLLYTGAAVMLIGELLSRIAFYNLWWITM